MIFRLDKFDLEALFGFLKITNLEKASVKTSEKLQMLSRLPIMIWVSRFVKDYKHKVNLIVIVNVFAEN